MYPFTTIFKYNEVTPQGEPTMPRYTRLVVKQLNTEENFMKTGLTYEGGIEILKQAADHIRKGNFEHDDNIDFDNRNDHMKYKVNDTAKFFVEYELQENTYQITAIIGGLFVCDVLTLDKPIIIPFNIIKEEGEAETRHLLNAEQQNQQQQKAFINQLDRTALINALILKQHPEHPLPQEIWEMIAVNSIGGEFLKSVDSSRMDKIQGSYQRRVMFWENKIDEHKNTMKKNIIKGVIDLGKKVVNRISSHKP